MRCAICDRKDVDEVNAALALRSNREVGAEFGLNRESLRRHRAHIPVAQPGAEVIVMAGRRPTPRAPRSVEGDRRLTTGKLLQAVVERLAAVEAAAARCERRIEAGLGLREEQLVIRTLVMLRREARGYLELIARTGGLDAPTSEMPEARTVEDVERMLGELQREIEASR